MTQRYTDHELMDWRPAKNVGGSTVGAREVVEIYDGSSLDRSRLAVGLPDKGSSFAVNGPHRLGAGKKGRVCCGPVVLVKYNPSTGTPSVGSLWKPSSGSGSLIKYITGNFRCLRVVSTSDSLMLAQILDPELVPFRLTDTLYPLGSTTANLFYRPEDCGGSPPSMPILVRDTIDIMGPQVDPDTGGPRTQADADCCGWARKTTETYGALRIYDIVSLGSDCCPESASSSSPSGGVPSYPSYSSYPSGSPSSPSSPGSPSSPSSPGSPSSPISPSESIPSGSPVSPSSPASPSSPSSPKSTAIVPVSFNDTRYAALFTLEAPEVRFDDVMIAAMKPVDSYLGIDPKFIEVCHPGTIRVCGYSTDTPVVMSALVEGDKVAVRFKRGLFSWIKKRKNINVVVRLTGIRKGFLGVRFPSRTKNQFDHNERFINSAYPAEELPNELRIK